MYSSHIVYYKRVFSISNVTGRHRGPKRKLRTGYRVQSLYNTTYILSTRRAIMLRKFFFIVKCGIARFLCTCARYARIRRLGIILTLGYLCAKFGFCRGLHC